LISLSPIDSSWDVEPRRGRGPLIAATLARIGYLVYSPVGESVHEPDARRLERALADRPPCGLVERAGGGPADVAAARAVAALVLAPGQANELVASAAAEALDVLSRHGSDIDRNR
jgi:hypothetical protein